MSGAAAGTGPPPGTGPSAAAAGAGVASGPAPRRFRPELHGLRGAAIGLVVVYHVFIGRVSGGVDVFLFISAFLLTGTIAARLERGDRVHVATLLARTFKRLLAPAAVVVLATLAGALLWMPPSTWTNLLDDAVGSLLHVQNWVLIDRSVDYAAHDSGTSPLQHFWSLSVQGQIFVLWPLLMAGTGLVARALGRRPHRALVLMFAVVGAASFAWSVWSTAVDQPVAYFDTAARAWEFAAGSLLALLMPRLERAMAARGIVLRVLAGWLGLAGLISCGIILDVDGVFPGWIAAWPLACAALILVAGCTGVRGSADALLSTRPAAFLGDVAYALYLVHWPLLVLWLSGSGRESAGLLDGAVLIVLSLVLAHLLTKLVDTPVRRWPWADAHPARAGAVAALALVTGLAPAVGAQQVLEHRRAEAEARASRDNPGARVLAEDYTPHPEADPDAPVLPAPENAARDWVFAPEPCEGDRAPRDPGLRESCTITPGDEDDPVIVVVGSSRMEQHAGAIIPLAEQNGWRVMMLWQKSCPYSPGTENRGPECAAHNDAVAAYLEQTPPDAVATSTTLVTYDPEERVSPGIEDGLSRLTERGIPVLAFRDQPRLVDVQPTECLEEHGADSPLCTVPAADIFAPERPDAELLARADAEGPAPVVPVDMTPLYCPEGTCRPVIGNVAVYLDEDHISGTYARSTSGALQDQLDAAGWRW
ncbi:hypothetical protein BF93_08610 [Brachybacterium phenoliresistens]|uniref:Acyltransferase n=1 Tax=Brachybacterium phenoliresistens TaxID=396014 RepID=Z9JPP9_9MICO|nr:acyltransferase family protein [Brachybacterium phenoliresistens]EWS79983.1 hypothetical protein BF93_08610 [Brachybacterium phenoliresistens]